MTKFLLPFALYFLIFTLYFLPSTLYAQNTSDFTDAQRQIVGDAAAQLAGDSSLQFGDVGILVQDLLSGEIICRHNDTKSLIPASNMKIITTSVGLAILGEDYKFKTELQYDGTIKDSVLHGNIYLKGYGDPTLASPTFDSTMLMPKVLDSLVFIIKNTLKINKIDGKIIGDATAWSEETTVPTWLFEDIGQYYGAGPCGLSFNENQFKLSFLQQPQVGARPVLTEISPFVPEFQLQNSTVSVAGGGEDAYIYAMPYGKLGFVNGSLPVGNGYQYAYGAVPDPALFAAWHLRNTLIQQNIPVTDSATTVRTLDIRHWTVDTGKSSASKVQSPTSLKTTFFTWLSAPLKKILSYTNAESNNFCAETILRAIAYEQTCIADNAKGIAEILKFLKEEGIDTRGMFLLDGSGLSPRNGVSAYQVAQILRTASSDFGGTLPRPGEKGTLKTFLKDFPSIQARIRAKSGTISRVKSYSGYLTTLDGRTLVFSVIANNFTCSQPVIRKKIEIFLIALGEI